MSNEGVSMRNLSGMILWKLNCLGFGTELVKMCL